MEDSTAASAAVIAPSTSSTRLLERVTYVDEDGRQARDPLSMLDGTPVVDLEGVALLLANPALYLDYIPRSLWRGLELQRTIASWPSCAPRRPEDNTARFLEAVAATAGNGDAIAVAFSGGLDSLCVLYYAGKLSSATGRQLLALVVDLTDDLGARVSDVAARVIDRLRIPAQLVVLPPDAGAQSIPWSAFGPRGDAMPLLNARLSEEAAARGAKTVLTGSGADELCLSARFTTLALLREHRWRAACHYIRDVTAYDGAKGAVGEAVAFAHPRFRPSFSFSLFAGIVWGEAVIREAPALLAREYDAAAERHRREWLSLEFERARAENYDWTKMAARCAVYPRPYIPQAGPAPFRSPFTDSPFVEWLHDFSVASRYDETLETAYLRMKAPVTRLFPPSARPFLPRRKQFFQRAVAAYVTKTFVKPELAQECGLLRHDWRSLLAGDNRLMLALNAVELWLNGAAQIGAQFG